MNQKIAETLLQRGNELLNAPVKLPVEFTKNSKADELLNDFEKYPHAFVLACVMDRQIKAERAWLIPYYFSLEIDGFEFKQLQAMDSDSIKAIFVKKKFHRFNEIMAKNFYNAIQKIHSK